jgi:hypothetical protein
MTCSKKSTREGMEAVISLEGQIQMVKPTSTKKSVVSTLHHKIRQKYKRTKVQLNGIIKPEHQSTGL